MARLGATKQPKTRSSRNPSVSGNEQHPQVVPHLQKSDIYELGYDRGYLFAIGLSEKALCSREVSSLMNLVLAYERYSRMVDPGFQSIREHFDELQSRFEAKKVKQGYSVWETFNKGVRAGVLWGMESEERYETYRLPAGWRHPNRYV